MKKRTAENSSEFGSVEFRLCKLQMPPLGVGGLLELNHPTLIQALTGFVEYIAKIFG